MAKHPPCSECKSGSRHKADCSRRKVPPVSLAAPSRKAKEAQRRPVRRAVKATDGFLADQTVEELVQLRVAIDAELREREEAAERELQAIRAARREAA
jgi:hypothetical protein